MSTRRLFDEDAHLCDFASRIVAIRDSGPWVALEATAFFPEDGGQPSDRGTVDGVAVVELAADPDGTIWHRLAAPIDGRVGSIATGRVDPVVRRDHRQQHTGQHVLSRAFLDLFGARTESFHMGAETSTIDLAIDALDDGRIRAAEELANGIVFDDRAVTVTLESRAEGLPLRTVAIEELEAQHCCGTHVKRTGEIGVIKILRTERIRGLARAHFVCGGRALRVLDALVRTVDAAARPFSAGWLDLPRAVEGALEQAKAQERRAREWRKRWSRLEADRLAREAPRLADGTVIVRAFVEGADAETLRALASDLTGGGGTIAILSGSGAEGRRPWAVARAKDLPAGREFDAKATLETILNALEGRGGGDAFFAQGACPAAEEACRARLDRVEP